jgi:hypothetical protein
MYPVFPNNGLLYSVFGIVRSRYTHNVRQLSGFSFVGPKSLNDILKQEKVSNLSKADVMDLWISYHENKEGVHGAVLERKQGTALVQRASLWCVM